jgi:DNA-binding response OmpR family regulator
MTKTLLVVDDDIMIGMVFSYALEPSGYNVISVTDPRKAVDAAMLHNPDVVVLDYHMPYINGVELHGLLKAAGCNAKFIFVTAEDGEALTETMRQDSDFGVTKKPFNVDDLVALVNVIMPIARMSKILGDV